MLMNRTNEGEPISTKLTRTLRTGIAAGSLAVVLLGNPSLANADTPMPDNTPPATVGWGPGTEIEVDRLLILASPYIALITAAVIVALNEFLGKNNRSH